MSVPFLFKGQKFIEIGRFTLDIHNRIVYIKTMSILQQSKILDRTRYTALAI